MDPIDEYFAQGENVETYHCHQCGWSGPEEETADDGPDNEWCCPACGERLR